MKVPPFFFSLPCCYGNFLLSEAHRASGGRPQELRPSLSRYTREPSPVFCPVTSSYHFRPVSTFLEAITPLQPSSLLTSIPSSKLRLLCLETVTREPEARICILGQVVPAKESSGKLPCPEDASISSLFLGEAPLSHTAF